MCVILGVEKERDAPLCVLHYSSHARKELPVEEAAARFGISVDQVYLTKHRVKEALKQ